MIKDCRYCKIVMQSLEKLAEAIHLIGKSACIPHTYTYICMDEQTDRQADIPTCTSTRECIHIYTYIDTGTYSDSYMH